MTPLPRQSPLRYPLQLVESASLPAIHKMSELPQLTRTGTGHLACYSVSLRMRNQCRDRYALCIQQTGSISHRVIKIECMESSANYHNPASRLANWSSLSS